MIFIKKTSVVRQILKKEETKSTKIHQKYLKQKENLEKINEIFSKVSGTSCEYPESSADFPAIPTKICEHLDENFIEK